MGSGSGPRPQTPDEDRPLSLAEGWVFDEQGVLQLIPEHNPFPSEDDLRKARAASDALAAVPAVMREVRRLRKQFEAELKIAERVRVDATFDAPALDIGSLSDDEEAVFLVLLERLRGPVAAAAGRCKAALRDGRFDADMIRFFILHQLFPEALADSLFAGWLAWRVRVFALPPNAPTGVAFPLEPGQFVMVFRGASQSDREACDKGIYALQQAWNFAPLKRRGRPKRHSDPATAERSRVAARLQMGARMPTAQIAHILGIKPDSVPDYVKDGNKLLQQDRQKDRGSRWREAWQDRWRELTKPRE